MIKQKNSSKIRTVSVNACYIDFFCGGGGYASSVVKVFQI